MLNLIDDCILKTLNSNVEGFFFDCQKKNLTDFFFNEAFSFHNERTGKTYYFVNSENQSEVIAYYTLLNDSINTLEFPSNRRKRFRGKVEGDLSYFPAIKIGRLAINQKYKGCGIGDQLLEWIKTQIVFSNDVSASRFITLDADNHHKVIEFYQKNGFNTFLSEEQELSLRKQSKLRSRFMFIDIKQIVS